jgi:hypothetical protein
MIVQGFQSTLVVKPSCWTTEDDLRSSLSKDSSGVIMLGIQPISHSGPQFPSPSPRLDPKVNGAGENLSRQRFFDLTIFS